MNREMQAQTALTQTRDDILFKFGVCVLLLYYNAVDVDVIIVGNVLECSAVSLTIQL